MGKFPWDAPEVVVVQRCPPLKKYPADKLKRAAKELRALPEGAATPEMVRDYGLLRKQCAVSDPSGP